MAERKMKRQKKVSSGGHGRVLARQKSSEVMNEKEKLDRLEAASVLSSLMFLPPKSSDEFEKSPDEVESENQPNSRVTYIPGSLSGNPVTAPSTSLKTQSTMKRGSGTPGINSVSSNITQNAILARLHTQLSNFLKGHQSKSTPQPQSPLTISSTAGTPQNHQSKSISKTASSVPSVVLNAETSKLRQTVSLTKTINKDVASALRQIVSQTKKTESLKSAPVADQHETERESSSPTVSPAGDAGVTGSEKPETEHSCVKKDSTDTNLPLKKRRLIGVSEQNGDAQSQTNTTSAVVSSRLPSLSSAAQIENVLQMARDYPEVMIGNSSKNILSGLVSQKQSPSAGEGYKPVQFDPRTSLMVLSDVKYALTPDEDGDLPLHMAVVHEDLTLVKKYIDIMAMSDKKVDRFNKLMQTPLHLAVLVNNPTIVAELLRVAADPNLVDRHGRTSIHLAVEKGFFDCLNIIFECSLYNCELNGRDFNGYPPLHTCVENDDPSSLIMLKKHGADLNVQDGKAGRSVLFYATEYNRTQLVDMLLGWGANAELQNYAGVSAYMTSQSQGYEKISSKLHQALEGKFTPDMVPPTIKKVSSNKKIAIPKFPSKVSLINPDIFRSRSNSVNMETSSGHTSRRASTSSSPMDLTMARPVSPGDDFLSSSGENVLYDLARHESERAINRSVKEKHAQLVAALEGRNIVDRPSSGRGHHGSVNSFNKCSDLVDSALNIENMTVQDLIMKAQSEKNIQFLNQLNEHIVRRIETMKTEHQQQLTPISRKVIKNGNKHKKGLHSVKLDKSLKRDDQQMEANNKDMVVQSVEELDALPSDSGSVAVSVSLEDGVTVDVHIKEEQVEHSDEPAADADISAPRPREVKKDVQNVNKEIESVVREVVLVDEIQIKKEPMEVQEDELEDADKERKDGGNFEQEITEVDASEIQPSSPEMPVLTRAVSVDQEVMEECEVVADELDNTVAEVEESLPELSEQVDAADASDNEQDSDMAEHNSQGSQGFECSKDEELIKGTGQTVEESEISDEQTTMEVDVSVDTTEIELERKRAETVVINGVNRTDSTEKVMEVDDSDVDDDKPLVIDESPARIKNSAKASSKIIQRFKEKKTKTKYLSEIVSVVTQSQTKDEVNMNTEHTVSSHDYTDSSVQLNDKLQDERISLKCQKRLSKNIEERNAREEEQAGIDTACARNLTNSSVDKSTDTTCVLKTVSNTKSLLGVDDETRESMKGNVRSSSAPLSTGYKQPARAPFLKSKSPKLSVHPPQGSKPVRILVDKSKKTEALLNHLLAAAGSRSDIKVGSIPIQAGVPVVSKTDSTCTNLQDTHSRVVTKSKLGQVDLSPATKALTGSVQASKSKTGSLTGSFKGIECIKDVKVILGNKVAPVIRREKTWKKSAHILLSGDLHSGKVSLDTEECSKFTPKDKSSHDTSMNKTNGETSVSEAVSSNHVTSSVPQLKKSTKLHSKFSDGLPSEPTHIKSLHTIPQSVSSSSRKTMTVIQSGRGATSCTEGTLTRVNPDIKNKLSKALQSPQRRLAQTSQVKLNETETPFPNFQGISGTSVTCSADSTPTRTDS